MQKPFTTDSSDDNTPLYNKRIIDMTGSELADIVRMTMAEGRAADTASGGLSPLTYGIKGLARLLGCSDATAWRYKKSGKFDGAISQTGKTIVFDTLKVLDVIAKRKEGGK